MTITYFPFDDAYSYEADWSDMGRYWLQTGVIPNKLNDLEVYADSSGMQVKVKTGWAWMMGHMMQSDAEETVAITAADGSNDRIDRVVIGVDWTLNTIDIYMVDGTPAETPEAPALTQTAATWEISLAQVLVSAGVITIASEKITDERDYAADAVGMNIVIGDGLNVITTGVKGFIEIPDAMILTAARLVANASGSLVIDVWKDTYANFPPTNDDTITGGNEATLSSAQKSEDLTLSGWTTTFSKGDWLAFNVDSATTVKQATLSLTGFRLV